MAPRVSVIFPVYNAERYLYTSIGSILSQRFTDFELIIINDGSTDRSAEIIDSMQDDRIVFVNYERNRGTATVSNHGLKLAKGEFIAFMDADDFSFPDRFEKQVRYLEDHPEIGILGTGSLFSDTKKLLVYPEADEKIRFDMFFYYPFRNPTLMLRAQVIRAARLEFNPVFKYTLDYEFISRMIAYTRAANLQECLLVYMVHEQQVSTIKRQVFLDHADLVSISMLSYFGIHLSKEEEEIYVKLRHGQITAMNDERINVLLNKIRRARTTNLLFQRVDLNLLTDRVHPVRKQIVASKNIKVAHLSLMLKNLNSFHLLELFKYSLKAFCPNRS